MKYLAPPMQPLSGSSVQLPLLLAGSFTRPDILHAPNDAANVKISHPEPTVADWTALELMPSLQCHMTASSSGITGLE